ncbi:hypothetical protein BH10BAC3_BH10BAC3_34060 [soil metagenome]
MLNSDFENKVQQKMEELTFTPDDAVWEKIEAALPEKKKQRRFIFSILLLLVLFYASFLLWNHLTPFEKIANTHLNPLQNFSEKKSPSAITDPEKKSAGNTISSIEKTSTSTPKEKNINTRYKEKQTNIEHLTNRASLAKTVYLNEVKPATEERANLTIEDGNDVTTNNTGKSKIQATAAMMDYENADSIKQENNVIAETGNNTLVTDNSEQVTDKQETITATQENVKSLSPAKQSEKNQDKKTDSLFVTNTDTITTVATTKEKKRIQKWSYGIHAAVGISNVTSGLFNSTNAALYADAYTNSTGGNVNSPDSAAPGNPSHSIAFSAGLFVKKSLGKNWSLNTGLYYSYHSNKILVGSKVDSAINLNINDEKIASDNFYRGGRSENYTNKFHLLQIPLLVQYKLPVKLPVYLEAGATVSYLMHSNSLQYNGSKAAYFTNTAVFNKLLFSFNAGAGIDLARKVFPFSIWYRFNYSLNSVTKQTFGKQHLLCSMLYINIPLKK